MILLGKSNDNTVEVIDGQQRITTITILLAALRNSLKSLKDKEANDIADMIQSNYIVKKIDGVANRVLETNSSYPFFANHIQDDEKVSVDVTSDEESGLKETFDTFMKELTYKRIRTLVKKITV